MNLFIIPHINTEDTMYKSTLFSVFTCTPNDLNNPQQQQAETSSSHVQMVAEWFMQHICLYLQN